MSISVNRNKTKFSAVKVRKYSIDEIIENGKDLIKKRDQLSDTEYGKYIREKYDIERRRATRWINIVIRFENRLGLIKNLPETIVAELTSPELTIKDVEQLIIDRHSEKIKPDSCSMHQAIIKLKNW